MEPMTCDLARRQILLLIYDELDAQERRDVGAHLRGCASCSEALAEERRVQALLALSQPDAPPESLLQRCRRDLAGALAREVPAQARPDPERRRFWTELRLSPAYAAGLVAAGFLAGWMTLGSGLSTLRQLAGRAMLGGEAEAAVASVSALVMDPESGTVRVSYDTLQRRSIEGPVVDPDIRHLLIGTLEGSLNAGLRLDALDALRGHAGEREVRAALLRVVREDRNVGARLKALEALHGSSGFDPEARRAVVNVLLLDDNPGVRVRAIDLLSAAKDPRDLPIFERLAREDANDYVRLRSSALADELAFAETR
jgi:hypothetical protein